MVHFFFLGAGFLVAFVWLVFCLFSFLKMIDCEIFIAVTSVECGGGNLMVSSCSSTASVKLYSNFKGRLHKLALIQHCWKFSTDCEGARISHTKF